MARNVIESRLRALRRVLRRLIVAAGAARIVLLLFALLAACLLLDWSLHLPPEWRLALALGSAAGTLVAVYAYLVRPLLVPMPEDQLALLFERRFPQLSDVLVTAVQLSRGRGSVSSDLVGAVVENAEHAAEDIEPRQVPRSRTITRLSVLAAAALAVSVTFGAVAPATTRTFAARFVNPYGPARWPRHTELVLYVNERTDPELTVIKGRRIEVRIEARNARQSAVWSPPGTVHVDFEPASGTAESRRMRRTGDRTYLAYYNDPSGDLTITARAGGADDVSAAVHVTIPPRVEQIWTWPRPPAYADAPEQAGRPEPNPGELNPGASEVRALEGSTLTVLIRTNKGLGAGGATVVTDTAKTVEMTAVDPRPADGPTHRSSFPLDRGMKWFRVDLVHRSESGAQKNEHPRTVQLRVIEDRPPKPRIVKPGREMRCTRYAVLPLEVAADDDRGLRRIWLSHQRLGSKETPRRTPLREFPPDDRLRTELNTPHRWDLADLGLHEGDTLTYWCGAEDWRGALPVAPGRTGQVGKSREYFVRIVSHADLAHELDDQLIALRDRLKKAKQRQEADRDQVTDLLRRIAEGQPITERERATATNTENVQRELVRAVRRIANGIGQVRDRMEDNRIGSFADRRKLDEIQGDLEDVAKSEMTRAADFVKTARKDLAGRAGRTNLQTAARVQARVITRLRNAITRMKHDEGIANLVRAARELLRKQRAIRKRTAEFRQRPGVFGTPPDDLKPKDREALNTLVRNQQLARNAMRNLEQDMLDVFEKLKVHDPRRARLVEKAQEQAAKAQIRLMMEQAAENLRHNHIGKALTAQASAIAALEALLELLQNARRQTGSDEVLAQVISDVRSAIDDIRRLHEAQAGHASDAAEINKNIEQGKRLKQIRRRLRTLRDEQEQTTKGAEDRRRLEKLREDQDEHQEKADAIAGELDKEAKEAAGRRAPQTPHIQDAGRSTANAGEQMDRAAKEMEAGQAAKARGAGTRAKQKLTEADRHLGKALDAIEKKRLADTKETALKQGETKKEADPVRRRLRRLAKENEKLSQEASQGLGKAADQVGGAQGSMKKAHASLEKNDNVTGEEEARKARDQLADAQRRLEELRDELEKRKKEQKLLDLIVEIQPMLEKQLGINDEM
ncbi:MAG: DUF4175 family protein, partial [Planctomycetota bacterium]